MLLAWGIVLGTATAGVWLWLLGSEVAGVAGRPVPCSAMTHDPVSAFQDGARALAAALVRDGHTADSAAQWFHRLITPHRVRQWLELGDPADAPPAAPTLPPPATARAFQPAAADDGPTDGEGEPSTLGEPLLEPEAEPVDRDEPVGD